MPLAETLRVDREEVQCGSQQPTYTLLEGSWSMAPTGLTGHRTTLPEQEAARVAASCSKRSNLMVLIVGYFRQKVVTVAPRVAAVGQVELYDSFSCNIRSCCCPAQVHRRRCRDFSLCKVR